MDFPNISPIWLLVLWIANQILSAAVQSLDAPDTTSGKFYRFFYKFSSLLISDFKSFAAKIPAPQVGLPLEVQETQKGLIPLQQTATSTKSTLINVPTNSGLI